MSTTRTLLLATALLSLLSLVACERYDEPGEPMDEQEFPDENVETRGYDVVEPGTQTLRESETAAPNAPQGLAPGAPGLEGDEAPQRLEGESASER